ncbi:hypothetical protein CEXT_413861 [Caerostris extrusa]|uniref:Uncharacterized protein n=1 Tax=Caerostris extrusa TaxID=172846 RepID=A0AAV4TL00_CAEEX|nr:hypothetical protein CEXT_413861 [Caerostris extrusa]
MNSFSLGVAFRDLNASPTQCKNFSTNWKRLDGITCQAPYRAPLDKPNDSVRNLMLISLINLTGIISRRQCAFRAALSKNNSAFSIPGSRDNRATPGGIRKSKPGEGAVLEPGTPEW